MTQHGRQGTVPDEAVTSRDGHKAVRITLPSAMSAVETGRLAMLDYLTPLAVDEMVINRLEVVLEELVTNVIRHGAVDSLTVEICARPEAIELAVEDAGPEFNPLESTTPSRFTTLEEAEVGGLGIPLVRRLARSVRYERVEDEEPARNRLTATIARA